MGFLENMDEENEMLRQLWSQADFLFFVVSCLLAFQDAIHAIMEYKMQGCIYTQMYCP